MPGEVKDPTGGKCVTCSGFTTSREKDNSCVSPGFGYLNVNHLRPKHDLLSVVVTVYTIFRESTWFMHQSNVKDQYD